MLGITTEENSEFEQKKKMRKSNGNDVCVEKLVIVKDDRKIITKNIFIILFGRLTLLGIMNRETVFFFHFYFGFTSDFHLHITRCCVRLMSLTEFCLFELKMRK